MAHGPGTYICWSCFDLVSNLPTWHDGKRIELTKDPPDFGYDYRAKRNAPCGRCGVMIHIGDKTQKVTLDTDFA